MAPDFMPVAEDCFRTGAKFCRFGMTEMARTPLNSTRMAREERSMTWTIAGSVFLFLALVATAEVLLFLGGFSHSRESIANPAATLQKSFAGARHNYRFIVIQKFA